MNQQKKPVKKQPERKTQSKMKLATKIRLGIIAVIAFAILIVVSPVFSIRQIVVETDDAAVKQLMESELSDAIGTNGVLYVMGHTRGFRNMDALFSLRAKDSEDILAFRLPELKNIRVAFSFPNTLTVTYQERTPAYLIFASGVYVCADEEGIGISVHTDRAQRDLPVVRGMDLSDYKVGQRISSQSGEQMKTLNVLFKEITLCDSQDEAYKLSAHIEIADVSEYNEIWLFVDETFSVNLGDTDNIEYKIPALREILQTEQMQGKKGLIDFTVSDQPVFIAE